jgi:toxin ParE1/3/4
VKFRISIKAAEDIDKIWLYTNQQWSTEQADEYYRLLYQEIDLITRNFYVGKDISEIKLGYRQVLAQSHAIIYKRGDDGVVEIVRVLHQRMNIINLLK